MIKKSTVHIHPQKTKGNTWKKLLNQEDFGRLLTSLSTLLLKKLKPFMEKHDVWLSSEKDRKIFFRAFINPSGQIGLQPFRGAVSKKGVSSRFLVWAQIK